MSKRLQPEQPDLDNPEWTAQSVAAARPAREVLQELFSAPTAQALLRPRGRPKAAVTKERISIRLSPDVLQGFRQSGDGWQTRMDAALREWLRSHSLLNR
jgi:uncharacterized protein (DUF4415 family)